LVTLRAEALEVSAERCDVYVGHGVHGT
jgi:hypothetical protein